MASTQSPEFGLYLETLRQYAEGKAIPIDVTVVLSRATLLTVESIQRIETSLQALERVVRATERMGDQLMALDQKVSVLVGLMTRATGLDEPGR